MERSTLLRTAVSAVVALLLVSCASSRQAAPPQVDPTKEQLLILQKQILELQALQAETRKKLDEQTAATESLAGRLKTVEEQRAAYSAAAEQSAAAKKKGAAKPAAVKKKKSKTVRRQEQ